MHGVPSGIRSSIRALAALVAAVSVCGIASAELDGEFARATQPQDDDQIAGYYQLGLAYEFGRKVEKDLFEAARQYQLAAEQGHVEAQFSLALLLAGAVSNSPRSPQKSFAWFGEAARGGHARAAYFLALGYQTGAGTDSSSEKAFQWYRRSALGGNGEAMNALARMYAEGDGIRLNLSNAYAWNEVAGVRGYDLAQQYRDQLEAKMSREELALGKKLMRRLMKKYAGGPG